LPCQKNVVPLHSKNDKIMTLTIDFIEKAFCKYNDLYWDGRLEKPKFRMTRAKKALGQLEIKRIGTAQDYTEVLTIGISDKFIRSEKEFANTLLHEMVHLYIHQMHIKDNNSHGKKFMEEAERINAYGWNIGKYAPQQDNTLKKKENCTMFAYKVLTGGDTKYFLFRTSPRWIPLFEIALSRHEDMYIDWFMFNSDDDRYAKFPKCKKRVIGQTIDASDYNNIKRSVDIMKRRA